MRTKGGVKRKIIIMVNNSNPEADLISEDYSVILKDDTDK